MWYILVLKCVTLFVHELSLRKAVLAYPVTGSVCSRVLDVFMYKVICI